MIRRVRLHNFRSIADCDVELGPLTLLVGPNGSGKSNFLHALDFLSDALNIGLESAVRRRGGMNSLLSRWALNDPEATLRIEVELELPEARQGTYSLERLTEEVSGEVPADECGAEMEEGCVEVVEPLVADEEASVAMQPGEGALDDPAVAAEFGRGLDALARDARGDASGFESGPAVAGIVGLVGVELVWAVPRGAVRLPDRRDRVDDVQEHRALVDVRRRQEAGQRDALPIGHQMVLGTRFAAIGRVGADRLGRWPPFFSPLAGTVELSMLARLQSIRSASPRRVSRVRCSSCQTPASCQSRSRRQHVMPHPHPISWGRSSHWIPVFITKTIPVRQARSGIRGRRSFFFGPGFGSNGSTIDHNSSLTSGLAMQNTTHGLGRFC
jgi:energy-coupling factor transporter ATP-binding protein EcfA2